MTYSPYVRNVRLYLLIALLCGLFTLFVEYAGQSSTYFQAYAQQRTERSEARAIAQEPM
jgi:hypothetical protein